MGHPGYHLRPTTYHLVCKPAPRSSAGRKDVNKQEGRGGSTFGSSHRGGLPALPARRDEAVPEGGPLFQGQVLDRAAQLPAGAARPQTQQAARLRHPVAGEAEGQADLRAPREPVPTDVRARRAPKGHHGRQPAGRAREAARQRGLFARASPRRGRRRGSSCATATSRSTERRSRFRPSASGRATWSPSRRRAGSTSRSRPPSRRPARAASRRGSISRPESFSGRVVELPKREDIKLPIAEQLIVELYSK